MRAQPPAAGLPLILVALSCGTSVGPPAGTPTQPPSGAGEASVVQHHNSARRDGLYIQPSLTRAASATMVRDASFDGSVQGSVYAQPLFVENGPGGKGSFIVVTENDTVHALDESTGRAVWAVAVGTPAGDTGAGCGNIAPLGITGTPYVDLPSRTLFLDAVLGNTATILTHQIHALSLDDGSERPGWPLDASTVTFGSLSLNPVFQNQRGGLLALGGTLFVPYGGHAGDCGEYHGWVVAVPFSDPTRARGFATSASGGGIWGPPGLASDGSSVFAATGNTFGATTWGQGEAVLRLGPGATFSGQPADFFAPSNWRALDDQDLDVGGSGVLLLDVPGATPSALAVALGKNGVAYLLNRANLGGFGSGDGSTGEGLASTPVAGGEIIGSPAAVTTPRGTFVVFHGAPGLSCPAGQGGELVALRISAGAPPGISTAWCAPDPGPGSPMVTTTDGQSDAVVWSTGGGGSQRLLAWDAETGAAIFGGGGEADALEGAHSYTTPIAVHGRIFVAGDGRLYAFRTR